MVTGTCTYNESLYDVFTKNCKFFQFETCPYLSESAIKSYKLGNILCIYGNRRSGKTLFISHIIKDLLNTSNLKGKIVLIDTELGFNFENLKNNLDSLVNDDSDFLENDKFKNFLYLPVRSYDEFNIILDCLDSCVSNQSLTIHSLVIDSLFGLYKRLMHDKQHFNKTVAERLNYIIEMCTRNSIFLIYTSDVDSSFDRKHFYIELKNLNTNKKASTALVNHEDNDILQTPEPKYQNKQTLDEILFFNDILFSYESNNSNEYRYYQRNNYNINELGMKKGSRNHMIENEEDHVRLKGSIPGSWISNNSNQKTQKQQISIFISSSRSLGRNYVTFVSKDSRKKSKHSFKSKNNAKIEERSKVKKIKESSKQNNKESNKKSIQFKERKSCKIKVTEGETMDEVDKENEKASLGEEILNEHNFKVYRIDGKCKYTECSYIFSNFI